jgi:eukaryotic-like serine/threonine-protein kinase
VLAWALAVVLVAAIGVAAFAYFEPVGGDGAPPAPAAVPLTLSAVRDYDPQGDGEEQPGLRGYAIDVDPTTGQPNPATAWYTERYFNDPAFGGSEKTGVGLILRLTAPAVATEMVVSSPTPGAGFQVLGPLVDGRRETLAQGTFSGEDQVVELAAAPPAEAYVLWITSLVEDGEGGYTAGVGQVELRGTPNGD